MKVFVWVSHGEIDIYHLETKEQKQALKASLVECLVNEGSSVTVEDSWDMIMECIEDQRYSDSDMFEYGTGVHRIKELV